jgi:hypothetical protein
LGEDTIVQPRPLEYIPVTMPNSNIVTFPSDLYLFFEAESLSNSSPAFISHVGLIITENDDVEWKNIYNRQMKLFLKRHSDFFES